jgi:DNA-binding transcriptional LysR family regulator
VKGRRRTPQREPSAKECHHQRRIEIAEPVDADDLERRVSDGRSELGLTDLALNSRASRRVHLSDQPIVAVLPRRPPCRAGSSPPPIWPPCR